MINACLQRGKRSLDNDWWIRLSINAAIASVGAQNFRKGSFFAIFFVEILFPSGRIQTILHTLGTLQVKGSRI